MGHSEGHCRKGPNSYKSPSSGLPKSQGSNPGGRPQVCGTHYRTEGAGLTHSAAGCLKGGGPCLVGTYSQRGGARPFLLLRFKTELRSTLSYCVTLERCGHLVMLCKSPKEERSDSSSRGRWVNTSAADRCSHHPNVELIPVLLPSSLKGRGEPKFCSLRQRRRPEPF